MGRPALLVREDLEKLGITEVTKDGKVYCGEVLLNPTLAVKSSRFKEQKYRTIHIYDPEFYQEQKQKNGGKFTYGKTSGIRGFVLSRVIWAWHNGVCPASMDVDHKDGNSLNDHLDNYQLLTRQENLAKRKGYRNQHLKSFRE